MRMPIKPLKTAIGSTEDGEVAPMYHLACFEGRKSTCYNRPVTSKKGVIGIGSPKTLAARSRITAQVCGFSVLASSYGGLNGRAQALPVNGLRQCPGLLTRSSCHPLSSGSKSTQLEVNHD